MWCLVPFSVERIRGFSVWWIAGCICIKSFRDGKHFELLIIIDYLLKRTLPTAFVYFCTFYLFSVKLYFLTWYPLVLSRVHLSASIDVNIPRIEFQLSSITFLPSEFFVCVVGYLFRSTMYQPMTMKLYLMLWAWRWGRHLIVATF